MESVRFHRPPAARDRELHRRHLLVGGLAGLGVVAVLSVLALGRLDFGRLDGHRPAAPASAAATGPPGFVVRLPAPVPGHPTDYVVRPGDTLGAIARHFGRSVAAIQARNPTVVASRLRIGATLVIPAPPRVEVAVASSVPSTSPRLRLTVRAAPEENVTFAILTPAGVFTGPPHRADGSGSVQATYRPAPVVAGNYRVLARGDAGTAAGARFTIRAARATAATG